METLAANSEGLRTETVLLDRCYFILSGKDFLLFQQMLDAPPKDNPRLARLLTRKPLWEK